MEPQRLFSFTWHPYALDLKRDYSVERPTLVEFHLEEADHSTLLLLVESGFDEIPNDRRLEAFQMNDNGWSEQMKTLKNYVETSS